MTLIAKAIMKGTNKESTMVNTDMNMDTVTMIPIVTMTITKPNTKKVMRKAMMRVMMMASLNRKMMMKKKRIIGKEKVNV